MRCLEKVSAWSPPGVSTRKQRSIEKLVTGLILIVANFSPELTPGSLVVAEQPLLVLDPPTDRKTLLKTLGCDWCKVGWVGQKRLMQPSLGEHEGTT